MPINLEIKKEVFNVFPDFEAAFLAINDESHYDLTEQEDLKQKIVSNLKSPEILMNHSYNDLYKEFYRKMGFKSKKLKKITTPIRQALRAAKTGEYRSINKVIDYCMLIEYTTLVSFQVYDLEKILSPISYAIAKGTETIIPFNGDECFCKKGELILTDQIEVLHSAYYGNNKEKSVNNNTKNYLVRIMFIPDMDKSDYNKAIDKMISFFPKYQLLKLSKSQSQGILGESLK